MIPSLKKISFPLFYIMCHWMGDIGGHRSWKNVEIMTLENSGFVYQGEMWVCGMHV